MSGCIIERLKEHLSSANVKHEVEIQKQPTLKDAHIYCMIHRITGQEYGPMIERYIRTKFNYRNTKNSKDDTSKDGKNIEIKVSLGGKNHTKFNFVKFIPSHNCAKYILTAYHLSSENVDTAGELYIFKMSNADIKSLILGYGGYAHGTFKEHGTITKESLNNENNKKEYALRPAFNNGLWRALLPFRVSEAEL